MPSAIIMSAELRESIETEVQEIRRALQDSFRLTTAASNGDEESAASSALTSNDDTTTTTSSDQDGGRVYTVLYTHRLEEHKGCSTGDAPSDEEPCSRSITDDRVGEQMAKEFKSFESGSDDINEDAVVEQEIYEEETDEEEQSDEISDDDLTYEDYGSTEDSEAVSSQTFSNDIDDEDSVEYQVALYHEGATELFRSLEEHNWADATRILHRSPYQAKIWVVRTNSKVENDWNCLWKRLPLHEAVRQHAPITLIDLLVQAYSGACRQCTQFGELPVHLAMDSGVAPNVVHLLLLHNIMAFQSTDQSGRMPLELMNDARQLSAAEHRSLIHVFHAVKKSWKEIQSTHKKDIEAVEAKNAESCVMETYSNAAKVQAEVDKQNVLRDELEAMKQEIEKQKEAYEEKILTLETETVELKKSLKASQLATARVSRDMEDAEVSHRHETAKLQLVLNRAIQWRSPQVDVVQSKIDASAETFDTLKETLSDHRDDLDSLLEHIGVDPMLLSSDTGDVLEEEWTD